MATKNIENIELSEIKKPLDIETLKQRTGATDDQLDKEVKENNRYMLAEYFDGQLMEAFIRKFELSKADHGDINSAKEKDGHQIAMTTVLNKWHDKDSTKATYRALVQIALELKAGALAMNICKYLVS